MARYRITVRGEGVELRGTLQAGGHRLSEFATAMQPFGLVIASEVGLDDANLEDWAREKEESERRDGRGSTVEQRAQAERVASYNDGYQDGWAATQEGS